MLESITLFILGLAALFTVFLLWSKPDQIITPVFGIFATVFWFISAGNIIGTHIPYSHLFENAADNSYTVVTGEIVSTSAATHGILFYGLGMICLAYTIGTILYILVTMFNEDKKKKEKERTVMDP